MHPKIAYFYQKQAFAGILFYGMPKASDRRAVRPKARHAADLNHVHSDSKAGSFFAPASLKKPFLGFHP